MPSFNNIPIMPKQLKPSMAHHHSPPATTPYPTTSVSGQRNAAIWSGADDEILLRARASGLNWQPIANRHFPNKTANACRKRHERLIERRHAEDWDTEKLELLAQKYMECRKEMWEILAVRLGERWAVVEAKCMEKGLKALQSTDRTAQRRASAASQGHPCFEEQGISDHSSDSGIGLSSDTEMEVGEGPPVAHTKSEWHAHPNTQQQEQQQQQQIPEPSRPRSLPPHLPLYRPPLPITRPPEMGDGQDEVAMSPQATMPGRAKPSRAKHLPASSGRSGISIQSVLSPAEPQLA